MLEIIYSLESELKEILSKTYNLENPKVEVSKTVDLAFGDLTTNIGMHYAKALGKNPFDLAGEIAKKLKKSELYSSQVVKPGYINFAFTPKYFQKELSEIFSKKEKYGSSKVNLGFGPDAVIVEFSSPNIAKPFGVGHLRSTIIGDAAARLLEFNNLKVIRDNHLGDWGTQFGKQIYAIKEWSSVEQIEKSRNPVKELFDLYVKFHAEAEKNPELDQKARDWFKKLENGDSEARKLWKLCVDLSLKEFNKTYEKLGVKFDMMLGESFFEDKMGSVLKELEVKKLLTESDGAKLVFFPNPDNSAKDKLPPLMILKKDGSTLYSTRDLATDKYRFEKWGKNILIINEVGSEQSLYFNQIYETEEKLGWCLRNQRIHLKHGLFRFNDRKMSTRKGDIIWLEDLIAGAVEKASAFNKEVAMDVAVAAIKWNDLKTETYKDVVFDWDDMLTLKGNTGPYVQYTYARAFSVLKKTEKTPSAVGLDLLKDSKAVLSDAKTFLSILSQFPHLVKTSTENLAPHHICHYLFSLCKEYNAYYDKNRIIGTDNEELGLALTFAVSIVVKTGLDLLGIKALEHI